MDTTKKTAVSTVIAAYNKSANNNKLNQQHRWINVVQTVVLKMPTMSSLFDIGPILLQTIPIALSTHDCVFLIINVNYVRRVNKWTLNIDPGSG